MRKVSNTGKRREKWRPVIVCDTAKVEIELAIATDGDFKGSGFIDVDPAPKLRNVSRLK